MKLSILYRGPLSSCNYGCEYCPFAKKTETKTEHDLDEFKLNKFVQRVGGLEDLSISVFFTPWGEALIHPRYQRAIASLSHMEHVEQIAIQTNLSCRLEWLSECRIDRVGIWATYHPGETDRVSFLKQCSTLDRFQARYSVGIVGMKEHIPEIVQMRTQLPPPIYLWVNAYKREQNYYTADEVALLQSIDHLFDFNNQYHASLGRDCRAGSSVVSVDGDGNVRRCHFICDVVTNLYSDNFLDALKPSPCTNQTCGCFIGYVHMKDLGLYEVFGEGVLARIPSAPEW